MSFLKILKKIHVVKTTDNLTSEARGHCVCQRKFVKLCISYSWSYVEWVMSCFQTPSRKRIHNHCKKVEITVNVKRGLLGCSTSSIFGVKELASAGCKLSISWLVVCIYCFVLGLLFNPEGGYVMFFWNIRLSKNYTASWPEAHTLHIHCCWNLTANTVMFKLTIRWKLSSHF